MGSRGPMRRLAVCLRAINVGGTGKLTMADFKAMLSGLGFAEPQTLGAAGSAVIGTDAAPAVIEAQLEAALNDSFGLATEVMARGHDDLAAVLAANPFAQMAEDDPGHLLVLFLKGEPQPAGVARLREKIVGPEIVEAGPACLYIAYPAGIGTSKLTGQVIEKAIGLKGTGRNWNTVRKLAALTAAANGA